MTFLGWEWRLWWGRVDTLEALPRQVLRLDHIRQYQRL
jgi:hypothetical protein